ncbi:hypothetical protein AB0D34_36085 [Streptomyces sp. NPDC048420]|uniref:hypothetical protein n=1 Tax=Streptomyces sp. NPDC048420 TaxID=3155755 RepID=UPI003420C912
MTNEAPSSVVETSDVSINSPGASLVARHGPSPVLVTNSKKLSDLIWLVVWGRALTALARIARRGADCLDRAVAVLRGAAGAAGEHRGGGGTASTASDLPAAW